MKLVENGWLSRDAREVQWHYKASLADAHNQRPFLQWSGDWSNPKGRSKLGKLVSLTK